MKQTKASQKSQAGIAAVLEMDMFKLGAFKDL